MTVDNQALDVLLILPHSIAGRLIVSSICDGFQQLGHNAFKFDELAQDDFASFMSGKSFDYIVGYDFSPIKLKEEFNLDIPCIAYFSDVIESRTSGDGWDIYYDSLKKPDNYVFYWDKALCDLNKDIKNLFYLPHFVNCEIYKPTGVKKIYDLMFAGRLDTDYRLDVFENLLMSYPNLNIAWFAIEKHYKDALSRAMKPELIEKAYKGFIDNEEQMAMELNSSKIVYNINAQGISSLNYRTMQALACSTLVISDYRDEIALFNGSLPFYTDLEDLKSKINYYLENPQAYESASKACCDIVRANHNSKTGVSIILNSILNTPKD